MFETQMMNLEVNLPIEEAIDLGWKILSDCFGKDEVGIKQKILDKYWPRVG